MKIYKSQIQKIVDLLRRQLVNDDPKAREKVYSLYPRLRESFLHALGEKVAAVQTGEATRLNLLKGLSPEQKMILLGNINQAISLISNLEAILKCVMTCYRKGYNGCQEHATLMSAILILHFGVMSERRVECISLFKKSNRLCNHQFVVIGRQEGSDLEDVSSWGKDCLVVDSWGGWVEGIDNLPFGTGIANYLALKAYSGLEIKCAFDNGFGLKALRRYQQMPQHYFHKIEALTLGFLQTHVTSVLETFAKTLELPKLANPTPVSATAFAFYKPGSSSGDNQDDSQDKEIRLGID